MRFLDALFDPAVIVALIIPAGTPLTVRLRHVRDRRKGDE